MQTTLLKTAAIALLATLALPTHAEERLRMATTTSTDNSGLLKILHPFFEEKYGVTVDVIAVGTGKALKLGENGDVDIVFVHDPGLEKAFMEAGYGINRRAVMHNDFVIIGPDADPARAKSANSAAQALARIHKTNTTFISRGDESGTHQKEKAIWQVAGVEPGGKNYLAIGQGMGAVLQVANDKQAYALTDRGTLIAYSNKTELVIVHEGDEILFNPYHIIAVNPDKHPHAKVVLAQQYIDFVTSETGQRLIKNFTLGGQQLFYPDAIPDIE